MLRLWEDIVLRRLLILTLALCAAFVSSDLVAQKNAGNEQTHSGSSADDRDDNFANEVLPYILVLETKQDIVHGYVDAAQFLESDPPTLQVAAFVDKLNAALGEIYPFLASDPSKGLALRIIRITNIDEYNEGSGFESIGEAVFERGQDGWTVSSLSIENSE